MQTDQDLAALFERAVADMMPDVAGMVRRSEQLGRRLRRRARFSRAAGSAMTIVAATTAVSTALAWPFHSHPATTTGTSGADRGAASARRPAGKHALQHVQQHIRQRSAPAKPMPPRQMLRILRSLLPAGSVLSPVALGTEPGTLEVTYDDGQGKADVIITIGPFDQKALSCPNPPWTDEGTRPAGALPISCLVRTPPGGGVERDAVSYADAYSFYA